MYPPREETIFEDRVSVLHVLGGEPQLKQFPAVLPGMPFNLVTVWVNTCPWPWSNLCIRASILASWFVSCLPPTWQLWGWTGTLPQLGGLLCSSGLRPRVCFSQEWLWLICKWTPEWKVGRQCPMVYSAHSVLFVSVSLICWQSGDPFMS